MNHRRKFTVTYRRRINGEEITRESPTYRFHQDLDHLTPRDLSRMRMEAAVDLIRERPELAEDLLEMVDIQVRGPRRGGPLAPPDIDEDGAREQALERAGLAAEARRDESADWWWGS